MKGVKLWDNYWGEGTSSDKLIEERLPMFRRLIAGLPVKSILEVGCSNGYNLVAIAKLGN